MRVGSSWDDLLLCAEALGRGYDWGILCLRESRKNCKAEITRQDGFLFVWGDGSTRGAPTICLNKQGGHFFGEARFGEDFVVSRLDMMPPLLVWTFHGPSAQFSDDTYLDALSDLAKALRELTRNNHRSYVCIGEIVKRGSAKEPLGSVARVKDLVRLKELERSMAFLLSRE